MIEIRERTHIQVLDGKMKFAEDEQLWIEIPEDSLASMNIWGFTPELFDELAARFERFLGKIGEDPTKAEYYLPEVVNQLLAEGKVSVRVLPTHEPWFGVTYQEDVARVRGAMRNLIDEGVYPAKLWG